MTSSPQRLARDGVGLSFVDVGDGPIATIFIHGFAADLHHYDAQIAHFGARGRAIAVDLRGHGDSDAPEQDYSMEQFADDVAWLCTELGVEQAVVVGHSMGGAIAAVVASRHHALCSGVVVLDAAVVPKPELVGDLVGWADRMSSADYVDELRAVNEAFFTPYDDQVLKLTLQDRMVETPQHVLVSAAEALESFVVDNAAAGDEAIPASWAAPACFVGAGFEMNDMERFHRICPRLITGQVAGSGHYMTVGVPDQVNAMIDRFLAVKDSL